MAQSERIYWIDGQLQGGAYLHWQAVVDKFEVNRRTAFNDAKFMRERLGAPIEFSKRYKGWHYKASNYQMPFLALSDAEADTLHRTLRAAIAHLPPTDAAAAAQLAMRLSPYVRGLPVHGGDMPASSEIFLSGQPTLVPHLAITDELLADIRRAVDHHHRLRIRYHSAHKDEILERVVQPYLLLNWRGELYVSGYCELRETIRDFALHRIREREVLEGPKAFEVPGSFDMPSYLKSAFELRRGEPTVTVRARFNPTQSRWVRERIYHSSQTLTEEEDGSVIVSLTVSGTAEVKRFLLSFGADVEVLEPEELFHDIKAESEKIKRLYADK